MTRPRVLLDTNLYISVLLSPDPEGSAIGFILQAASQGIFELLLPDEIGAELAAVVARRTYLQARVSQEMVDALLGRVMQFAIEIPATDEKLAVKSRDPKDDFLLVVAILYAADFIVTRDKDLLVLGDAAGAQIVDPVAFLTLVRAMQEESETV